MAATTAESVLISSNESPDGSAASSIVMPRSRRVSNPGRPFHRPTSAWDTPVSPPTPPITGPPLPVRSSRRPPPPRSTTPVSKPPLPDVSIADPMHGLRRHQSFASLSGLLDSLMDSASSDFPLEMGKGLPVNPLSDSPLSPVEADESVSSSSSFTTPSATASSISKRTHALLELLSSERAYASDLALIRDVHLPLALGLCTVCLCISLALMSPLGQPVAFQHASNLTPAGSSFSTLTDGLNHFTSLNTPAMTPADAKIIFSNIPELAVFSDMFTERLEQALGNIIEEGEREDHVGELFLDIVCISFPSFFLALLTDAL
jgi:dynamin-binding protein